KSRRRVRANEAESSWAKSCGFSVDCCRPHKCKPDKCKPDKCKPDKCEPHKNGRAGRPHRLRSGFVLHVNDIPRKGCRRAGRIGRSPMRSSHPSHPSAYCFFFVGFGLLSDRGTVSTPMVATPAVFG